MNQIVNGTLRKDQPGLCSLDSCALEITLSEINVKTSHDSFVAMACHGRHGRQAIPPVPSFGPTTRAACKMGPSLGEISRKRWPMG